MCLGTVSLSKYLATGEVVDTANALVAAFERDGFAYVQGYQALVPQELVDRLFEYNERFFELPIDIKQSLAFQSSAENRGWLAFGQEQASLSKDPTDIKAARQSQPGRVASPGSTLGTVH